MEQSEPRYYVPLAEETRESVDTRTAARHLSRAPKTLLNWAASGSGPLAPKKVGGRLHWPVEGIRRLLRTGAHEGAGA